jgi:hypothetical protein
MFKGWLGSSLVLLVSVLVVGESGQAYTPQVDEDLHLPADLFIKQRLPNVIRTIPNISRRIQGTKGFEHSFDRHAVEWFGRRVNKTPENLRIWQDLIEQASRSRRAFRSIHDGQETITHLGRINGRWFLAYFFTKGDRVGELATAFFPSQRRLEQILQMFRH